MALGAIWEKWVRWHWRPLGKVGSMAFVVNSGKVGSIALGVNREKWVRWHWRP